MMMKVVAGTFSKMKSKNSQLTCFYGININHALPAY